MDPRDHDEELARFDNELQRGLIEEGKCGRPKRASEGFCRNRAGKRTPHLGRGPCYLHGGISKNKVDRRLKHGRYSTVSDVRLREILQELEDDPNPLDVIPELQLARANLIDWTERFSELKTAILNWNASRGEDERPVQVPDLLQMQPLLEAISRIVYRIERAQSDKYIPRGQLYRLMMAMGRVIDSRVQDERVREQIKDDWLRLEIP